jgi:AmiR/NasT family two-component response regulator
LSTRDVLGAVDLAREVAPRAFQYAITLANDEAPPSTGLAVEMRREVHQATGMILVQLDTSATEAFARLRAHAFASGISIQEVAKDVVQRRLNFRDLPE